MIKWFKNKYYTYLNRVYNDNIRELYLDYVDGKISKLCYQRESKVYQQKINENLNKIRL